MSDPVYDVGGSIPPGEAEIVNDTGVPEPVLTGEQLDTTDGNRDPLTTDDGLAEASENIPQIGDRDDLPGEGEGDEFEAKEPTAAPGLEVDDDGNDPLDEGDDDEGDDGQEG